MQNPTSRDCSMAYFHGIDYKQIKCFQSPFQVQPDPILPLDVCVDLNIVRGVHGIMPEQPSFLSTCILSPSSTDQLWIPIFISFLELKQSGVKTIFIYCRSRIHALSPNRHQNRLHDLIQLDFANMQDFRTMYALNLQQNNSRQNIQIDLHLICPSPHQTKVPLDQRR